MGRRLLGGTAGAKPIHLTRALTHRTALTASTKNSSDQMWSFASGRSPPMSNPTLQEFEVTVRVVLSGCSATVEAKDIDEAKEKAANGEWIIEYTGELVDWTIQAVKP